MIKKLFLVILVIVAFGGSVNMTNSLTICIEDYKQTNYYLFCRNNQQVVLVERLQVSFIARSNPNFNCLIQPSLSLNASSTIVDASCSYCFNTQTCIITSDFLDQNKLFEGNTFQVGNTFYQSPISLRIVYSCIGFFFFI